MDEQHSITANAHNEIIANVTKFYLFLNILTTFISYQKTINASPTIISSTTGTQEEGKKTKKQKTLKFFKIDFFQNIFLVIWDCSYIIPRIQIFCREHEKKIISFLDKF